MHIELAEQISPPRFLVGIGASAGGLESLEKLFRNLPTDTGMAFVVLQHLSPDFKSMMYELLGRDTSMAIHRAEDGMHVSANSVYLLPPRKEMIIADGRLHLSDKDPNRGLALPIDRFLSSLAREYGPRAVAIILSGSGSDGSRGVVEVAREGGYVLSESLETAKFDGMPGSAQAAGVVDEALIPEEIGASLVRLATEPEVTRKERIERDAHHRDALRGMDAIYQLIRSAYDIDFSNYKDTTIFRRVQRRMAMNNIADLDDYRRLLCEDPAELDALYNDLLIGVTQFFRDPETFALLEQSVLRELVQGHVSDQPIRAWVSGCATGEEAYSVAMAFHAVFERVGKPFQLKMFATDVHKASLEQAGRGIYPLESLQPMPADRRERYFEMRHGNYQVAPFIRESIVFALHNVLSDAPFTDLDFVSCRNLLIYLRPAAQSRAISTFHYALHRNGMLLLGGSETPGELSADFDVVHERARIYRKMRDARLPKDVRPSRIRGFEQPLRSSPVRHRSATALNQKASAIHEQLLDRFMSPTLLIDGKRTLVESFAGAEKLLRLRTRTPSFDILDLVHESLRTTLSGVIQRAVKEKKAVRFTNLVISDEGEEQCVNLTASPFDHPSFPEDYFLLSFESTSLPITSEDRLSEAAPGELDASRNHIRQLEDDLRYSRENLQATIEELETSNEELQATNEELIASNEELQSTNEELHSVNEELYTVNAEHQRKIGELAELNQDMTHLLENTDVATVFLDRDLHVRRFTSRVTAVFDLLEHDVGRPISSFVPKFHIEDLPGRLQQVLNSGVAFERETLADDGTCYLLRILPYRTAGTINGVVLMLVDVSSLEVLRDRLRWMSAIVESTDDAIVGTDLRGIITSWNQGAEQLYGYSVEEAIGQPVSILVPSDRVNEIKEFRSNIEQGERLQATDTIRLRKDGSPVHVSLTVSPVHDSLNRIIGISKIARDITHRIAMENEIRRQVRQRETFLATLSHELRNPLGAVLNASRVIRDSRADKATRMSATQIIARQVAIMRKLLADLLEVSRVAQDKLDLEREVIDLCSLVDVVRETAQAEIRRHGHRLIFNTAPHPLPILGDATRLVQVQVNLIHNAAKYSPQGSEIRVTFSQDGDWAVIGVADQGIGIPADRLSECLRTVRPNRGVCKSTRRRTGNRIDPRQEPCRKTWRSRRGRERGSWPRKCVPGLVTRGGLPSRRRYFSCIVRPTECSSGGDSTQDRAD